MSDPKHETTCYVCKRRVDMRTCFFDAQGARHIDCHAAVKRAYSWNWPKDKAVLKNDPVVDGD